MGYLWNIIQFSFGSLLWGVLIAFACMALFVFIIKGWWKNALFTIWSYLIGAILFPILVFQCTMIVGSLKIIDTCDEYEVYFNNIVNSAYEGWEEVTKEDSDIIIKKAIAEYPLLEYYIGGGDFIHASNPKDGVKITTLLSGYYKIRYVGARRVF